MTLSAKRSSGTGTFRWAPALVLALAVVAGATGPAGPARAEPLRLRLEAATTTVTFTLGATLHTVEGRARLVGGEIAFDSDGGPASGRIVVDARSADTGQARRDANMHEQVLESETHPEIVFLPESVEVTRETPDLGDVRLSGTMEIHGTRQPLTIPARVKRDGRNVWIQSEFVIPYVEWGMRDVSTFLLRVEPEVTVRIDALARLLPAASAPGRDDQEGG